MLRSTPSCLFSQLDSSEREYIEVAIDRQDPFYVGGNRFSDLEHTMEEIRVHEAEIERRGLAMPNQAEDMPAFEP